MFAHLHTHTEYSPLDGMGKMKDLIAAAAADGNPAFAATDHGTLGGIWKMRVAAMAAGIKYIPGSEIYLAFGDRDINSDDFRYEFVDAEDDVDPDEADKGTEGENGVKRQKRKSYMHLTVLAISPTGWKNLVTIHNEAQKTKAGKYPLVDYTLLSRYSEGLVVLSGCLGGPVAGPLLRDDVEGAREGVRRLISAVGKENVYIEVMDHGMDAQRKVIPGLRQMAEEFDLPLVATNDSHFTCEGHAHAHEAWLAVGTKARLSDAKRFKFSGEGHHLRSEAEMRALFNGADWWQEACDNTVVIADRAQDHILPEKPKMRLPKFPLPDGEKDSTSYLKRLVSEGARRRYGQDENGKLSREVNERLRHEFSVVVPMGYPDYFLIVRDVIEWCRSDRGLPTKAFPEGEPGKKDPIRVGPGRGSAAGSAISYCLGIVGVDPISNGLLFERFLDPERVGMPDVDVDFEQGRRSEVLQYLVRRYGKDRVAQIGTFGVARSKAAIVDAARVLDLTPLGEKLSALVPAKPVADSFAKLDDPENAAAEDFRKLVIKEGDDAARIIEMARVFEDVIKTPGVHACGVLISDVDMHDLIPLRVNNGKGAGEDAPMVTEWDGKSIDEFGLLKLDVLGLRNLDIVSGALRNIVERGGEYFDPDTLDPDDGSAKADAAWALIRSGRTSGIFQMESAGMTRLAEDSGPDCLDDLSSIVALYRPGPMGENMHTRWAARKKGTERVDYSIFTTNRAEIEAISVVLDESKGIIIFQEQMMRLGEVMAGFGAVERNALRKAISKKNEPEIARIGKLWMTGAVKEIRDEEGNVTKIAFAQSTAQKIWDAIKGAGKYAFNKAHSTAYGYLAYVTAYLKANWPVDYAASLLSVTKSKASDNKRMEVLVALAEDGIEVLAPDINRSRSYTAPEGGSVRLGLGEVKGVGTNASIIIAERERGGDFTSLHNFLSRVRTAEGNKLGVNIAESLIEAGAFDDMGTRMGQMMIARAAFSNPLTQPFDVEWGLMERSARQRARLSMITGDNPLRAFSSELRAWRVPDGKMKGDPAKPVSAAARTENGKNIVVLGILADYSEKAIRSGRMASISIEGTTGVESGVMWDLDRAALTFAPEVGMIVAAQAQVKVRTVEVEDAAGKITSEERRELMIRSLWPIEVHSPNGVIEPIAEPVQWLPEEIVQHPPVPVLSVEQGSSVEHALENCSPEFIESLKGGSPEDIDPLASGLWGFWDSGRMTCAIAYPDADVTLISSDVVTPEKDGWVLIA